MCNRRFLLQETDYRNRISYRVAPNTTQFFFKKRNRSMVSTKTSVMGAFLAGYMGRLSAATQPDIILSGRVDDAPFITSPMIPPQIFT